MSKTAEEVLKELVATLPCSNHDCGMRDSAVSVIISRYATSRAESAVREYTERLKELVQKSQLPGLNKVVVYTLIDKIPSPPNNTDDGKET